MVLVALLDACAAAEDVLLAHGLQANDIQILPRMIAAFFALKIADTFHFLCNKMLLISFIFTNSD